MAMTEDERELVFELATALSGALVINYEQVDFRDSPIIDRIAQVAAMMEAHHDWEVPPVIREALRKAVEAGGVIAWRVFKSFLTPALSGSRMPNLAKGEPGATNETTRRRG